MYINRLIKCATQEAASRLGTLSNTKLGLGRCSKRFYLVMSYTPPDINFRLCGRFLAEIIYSCTLKYSFAFLLKTTTLCEIFFLDVFTCWNTIAVLTSTKKSFVMISVKNTLKKISDNQKAKWEIFNNCALNIKKMKIKI